jgi:hypothetical protein
MTTTAQSTPGSSSPPKAQPGQPPAMVAQPTPASPAAGPALGTPVFVIRRRPPNESHLVKDLMPRQAELAWVVYQNKDGSVNLAGFGGDGAPFALSSVKAGDTKSQVPYFSLTPPAVAVPGKVVTS